MSDIHLTADGLHPRLRFDRNYTERVRLSDGRVANFFALGPQHASEVARGFDALSPRSRYLRFMGGIRGLTPAQLRYLTDVDGHHHFAIGATLVGPSGEMGVGVGRIVQVAGQPHTVEAAITVVDAFQRIGLGAALAQRLVHAASERGYRRIEAQLLAENRGMRALLRRIPQRLEMESDGPTVVTHLLLDEIEPTLQCAV